MKASKKTVLSTGVILLLSGCASIPRQPRQDEAFERKLARFEATLEKLRQERRIPGLSVAVVKEGRVVLARGLGLADLERQTPATPETPYNIASVTKPISAVVALKLVEEGKLDLDRPIAGYSEWAEFCQDFSQEASIFAKDLRCDPPAQTLRHLLSHTATGQPGERFSYNPILYSWASRPILDAVREPFSTLVQRYVFKPAGMRRSARQHRDLPLPAELAAALAPPHLVDESGALVRSPGPSPQGDGAAGGVISTVLDLARFDIALESGKLISRASYEEMMRPRKNSSGQTLPYALGWFVQDYGGRTLVWHAGWWEKAYSALYLKIPEERLTLILLANSEGLWWGNPLDKAEVEKSEFASAFLKEFL